MNSKEREQLKIFKLVEEMAISQQEAAARLRCSTRWVRKKFKRYQQKGDAGIVHQSRGRESAKRWDQSQRQLLMELLHGEWQGFGPTFAAEKLETGLMHKPSQS